VLSEKLNALIAPELKATLVLANKEGEKNLIVNLTKARYCDSSGLSAILVGNRLCKEANGRFAITGLQPTVKKVISIAQLDKVLNITAALNEVASYMA
jgi:anti-sigma B factor antagonist